jgi:hypothetical protein
MVFRSAHRELLWKLTSGSWWNRTLPADNLDDPAVYLLAKGLAEVVDGRLQATPAGFALRSRSSESTDESAGMRRAARQMSRRVRAVIGTIGILIGFVVLMGFVVLTVFYLHR